MPIKIREAHLARALSNIITIIFLQRSLQQLTAVNQRTRPRPPKPTSNTSEPMPRSSSLLQPSLPPPLPPITPVSAAQPSSAIPRRTKAPSSPPRTPLPPLPRRTPTPRSPNLVPFRPPIQIVAALMQSVSLATSSSISSLTQQLPPCISPWARSPRSSRSRASPSS